MEGIVSPGPGVEFFLFGLSTLQPRVGDRPVFVDRVALAMQLGHAGDMHLRHKVVLVDKVTHGPDEACRGSFGASFVADFYQPSHTILIFYVKLGGGSAEVFFFKGVDRIASRSVPWAALA